MRYLKKIEFFFLENDSATFVLFLHHLLHHNLPILVSNDVADDYETYIIMNFLNTFSLFFFFPFFFYTV